MLVVIRRWSPSTPSGSASMRRRFEVAPFLVEGESLRVTVSIGVAESDPGMAALGDLMKRADQALYDAKREGRNRVRTRLPTPTSREAAAA